MSAAGPLRVERPDVLSRLPASGHAVVEASAGTGKTHTIESLFVELVLVRGLPVESLLVVTFTEKAAAELTKRIRDRLRSLALGRVEEAPGGRSDADCWLVDPAGRRRLRRALASFGNASISTIHAFCRSVLSENAFLGGHLFQQELVPDEAVLRRALVASARGPLVTDPALAPWFEAWLDAGRAPRGGTKLDGLAKLLLALRRVRGTPFPALDAAALAAAVRAFPAAPASAEDVRAALRADRVHGNTIRAAAPALFAAAARVEAVRDDVDAPGLYLRLRSDDVLAEALDKVRRGAIAGCALRQPLTSVLRDACLALHRALVPLEAAVAAKLGPVVDEALARMKSEEGLLDYADMLAHVETALEGTHGEALRRSLRGRFRAALIDEFQDTDELQWRIFERLFLDASEGHSLFLVGDPKQAIYRFRGADVETYLAAREAVTSDGGPTLTLSTSWRATEDLVAALNVLGDDAAPGRLLVPPIPYGAPLSCARRERSLVLPDGSPAAPFLLLEVPGTGLAAPGVRRLIGRALAREVRRVLDGSLLFGERGGEERIEPSEVFVLTRSGPEAVEAAGYLEAEGIVPGLVRSEGLFASVEAGEVRSLLLALDDPDDRALRGRLLLSPFFGLSLDDLAALGGLPSDGAHLAPLRGWSQAAQGRAWETLLPRILDESGLARRSLFLGGAKARSLARVEQLFERLVLEGTRTRASAGELASWLLERTQEAEVARGDAEAERAPSRPDAVPVLTMHMAKGLEAKVVLLFGGFGRPRTKPLDVRCAHAGGRRLAVIGNPADPAVAGALAAEDDAEDRRLLYVAVTRAKARVVLPFFPPGVGAEKRKDSPDGTYGPLNERLRALVPGLAGSPHERLFRVERIEPGAPARPGRREARPIAEWTPPELPPLPDEEAEREREARLLASRAGLVLTSFSGLKATARRHAAGEREAPGRLDSDAPADAPRDPGSVLPEGELPPGIPTGLLLHSLLEEADLGAVAACASPAGLAESPAFSERARALLSRHGLDPSHLPRAAEVVHAALTTGFDLGAGRSLPPLVHAPRVVREMEFLFPLPAGDDGGERGFVQGFVDAVVESDGKVFVLDWKSDLAERYDPAALAAHVEARYALQARLYSAAVARLLGLGDETSYEARFGGWVYVFLRALGPLGPRAAVTGRVPFREIADVDADLARLLAEAQREPSA